ncbi:4-diphosphocytidyl-2-C-methyl-D-erythritol kinase [Variibacter gotjawalensis]|uniref:4-diphosphocytidyl-2-C-methyl-D-erythritol kinase n=1 Tax=Variibacter gotjawalensis TaxID=1333996 RepID=A0A0S3PT94_9BRAD|nr:4-(cytidine 5'-diphospho)-2-C-methyl-D-erythritol kinase [Variibacter gotjawalensis]NIK49369.1 4-diphosphocytidyl-2-C-methyl-D-erythritol kinase [Variibacter gotjawalensis]RZS51220.1 4-diphosphocytidyl-2-C-methyl-D-erythritol kinase [Variibacter gotjawalensis]BAT59054.1 4-diphosphocytidyl-2-C-methyl-D-erythritol kinase [Variibacter gotjawalensis]
MNSPLTEWAPAKVNLTLRVLGRRHDGYHELDSVVAFAGSGDKLALEPGDALTLSVTGPTAVAAGEGGENLVLKAARKLAERVENLRTGHFTLDKRLPVAAGLGGGSSDAAAALRLLARLNEIALDDGRLYSAAVATGADVPVCMEPRARVMRGIGDRLSRPLDLAPMPALLVNPGVAVATGAVFKKLHASTTIGTPALIAEDLTPSGLQVFIDREPNDLEAPAVAIQPIIAETIAAISGLAGCQIARMSGSGATCFGIFASGSLAASAAQVLRTARPDWWITATTLR